MILTVHAGHNPDGKIACGAVGYVKESTVAREIKNEIVRLVKLMPQHTIYDITVDDGISQANILSRLAKSANDIKADLNLSIHLNAGASQKGSDGKTTGTECWIYPGSESATYAEKITENISRLGFKNRGVKTSKSLYFLNHTNQPSIIVEVCFVDDPDDAGMINVRAIAKAIVDSVCGELPDELKSAEAAEVSPAVSNHVETKKIYRVQVGAFSKKENAVEMQKKLSRAGFDSYIVG